MVGTIYLKAVMIIRTLAKVMPSSVHNIHHDPGRGRIDIEIKKALHEKSQMGGLNFPRDHFQC